MVTFLIRVSFDVSSNEAVPGSILKDNTEVEIDNENINDFFRFVHGIRAMGDDDKKDAVLTAMRAKKKYGFIYGTVKQPEDNSLELEDWWTVNSMLVSWVFNTIEPSIRSTISYMENVKDLWEDIRQRFSIGNGPRVQQLRSDLESCKQDRQAVNYLLWKTQSFVG
ncbi:hypothetical protein Pint_34663 [Pistacia integerrima]|uniref:Uncharacterized protein n=1 Tax=Pistacia integerrima TaxID=434235 RepID=A0ACC0X5G1_9ROSI|nr:hypothetical protein Pint_34663 [Pistacia integerrima]